MQRIKLSISRIIAKRKPKHSVIVASFPNLIRHQMICVTNCEFSVQTSPAKGHTLGSLSCTSLATFPLSGNQVAIEGHTHQLTHAPTQTCAPLRKEHRRQNTPHTVYMFFFHTAGRRGSDVSDAANSYAVFALLPLI